MNERDLRHEEVRGVFAIGAVASIFAIDQIYRNIVIMGASIRVLTGFLLLFWFLYVLVMAVGVSEDLTVGSTTFFSPRWVEAARDFGHCAFMMGFFESVILLIAAPLFYLRDHGMVLQADIAAVIVLGVPCAYLFVGMVKKTLAEMKYDRTHAQSRRRGGKKSRNI